jgi:hypothetical protein
MGDDSRKAPESLRSESRGLSLEWLDDEQAEQLLLHLDGLDPTEAAWIRHHLEASPPATPEQLERVGQILGVRFASPPAGSPGGQESERPDPSPQPEEP